ncbi:GNAT family N-acetyltransferase [Streptomyces sp. NPDC001633]|uniref:GNAT family N-acetyltransferase n=1 Tax=unclassified Streptomyces TaxID=2593676 RepID=UPI0036AA7100
MRQATASDEPALMEMRVEAEAWLAAAGIDQWRNPVTRSRALAKWQKDIAEGRTWVAVNSSDRIVGTVTLAEPDRDFWSAKDSPEDAVYVAKLITARIASGKNVGGRILDWVSSVAQKRNVSWVRLDVWRTNKKLQQYYVKEGFRHVRTEAPPHRLSGWMAQRPATVILHPGEELKERSEPNLQRTA